MDNPVIATRSTQNIHFGMMISWSFFALWLSSPVGVIATPGTLKYIIDLFVVVFILPVALHLTCLSCSNRILIFTINGNVSFASFLFPWRTIQVSASEILRVGLNERNDFELYGHNDYAINRHHEVAPVEIILTVSPSEFNQVSRSRVWSRRNKRRCELVYDITNTSETPRAIVDALRSLPRG